MWSMADEGTIDLRGEKDDEPEFRIGHMEDSKREVVGNVEVASVSELEAAAMKPHDKVKVKFDNFVNLVATHAYEEIFNKHSGEDIIVSTDLLADLANAHEERKDRKTPFMFIFGIVLGVVLAWLLLRT